MTKKLLSKLATMPIYNAPDLTRRSIESLGSVDKYLVYNTVMPDIYEKYGGFRFKENKGCNPAWNEGMRYFLKGKWDWLMLGSSDVILHDRWRELFDQIEPVDEVYVPHWTKSEEEMRIIDHELHPLKTELTGGVMGAFIFLPRKAVEVVYPIPRGLNLWFGDEYIFTKLRNRGFRVMQLDHLFAYHHVSTGISGNPEAEKIIEGDKVIWGKLKAEDLQ